MNAAERRKQSASERGRKRKRERDRGRERDRKGASTGSPALQGLSLVRNGYAASLCDLAPRDFFSADARARTASLPRLALRPEGGDAGGRFFFAQYRLLFYFGFLLGGGSGATRVIDRSERGASRSESSRRDRRLKENVFFQKLRKFLRLNDRWIRVRKVQSVRYMCKIYNPKASSRRARYAATVSVQFVSRI